MQLSPRYDGPPVIDIDVALGDVSVPLVRQRRRLGAVLADLDPEQWAAQSRCKAWSVQDVVAHLVGTNQFWTLSIVSGLSGRPTRFLASIDPAVTPSQMVDALRALPPSEILDQYLTSSEELADAVTDLDETAWSTLAEGPPGHLALHAVALHALWDAWIHERDIVVPLALAQGIEVDEVAGCLCYCAAIGPAVSVTQGSTRAGTLAIVATDPTLEFTVEMGSTVRVVDGARDGATRIVGDAVTLVEGLSFRAPLDHGLAPSDAWLLGGLGEAFDQPPRR